MYINMYDMLKLQHIHCNCAHHVIKKENLKYMNPSFKQKAPTAPTCVSLRTAASLRLLSTEHACPYTPPVPLFPPSPESAGRW